MQSIIGILLYPYSGSALLLNLILSIIFSFLLWAINTVGPFALFTVPIWILLLPAYGNYCLTVGKRSAHGQREPPVMTYHEISPFDNRAITLVLLLSVITMISLKFIGPVAAILIMSFLTPAILSAFILTTTARALNPLNWFQYIWRLGGGYISLIILLFITALLALFIPDGLWTIAKVSLFLAIILAGFYATGLLIYANGDKLHLENPAQLAEQQRRERESRKKEDRFMGTVYQMVKTHRDSDAINFLLTRYHQQSAAHELENLYQHLNHWGPSRTLLCLGRLAIEKLDAEQRFGRAIVLIEQCQAVSPRFELADLSRTLFYAQMALDTGKPGVAQRLLEKAPERYGQWINQDQARHLLAKANRMQPES